MKMDEIKKTRFQEVISHFNCALDNAMKGNGKGVETDLEAAEKILVSLRKSVYFVLVNEANKKKIKIDSYHWETDPGHGWLVVPAHHLTEMKIAHKISTCSYISTDGETAYLEEDCDAGKLLNLLKYYPEMHPRKEFKLNYKENSFVRSLPSFSADKISKS